MNNSLCVVRIYGITKDSKTNNFMMVMQYADNGNLRQKLNRNFNSLSWENKLYFLYCIASSLSDIHKKGLTHQDFHSGNILNCVAFDQIAITDLGLCKPANEESDNCI